MTYNEFLDENQQTLLGYFLLSQFTTNPDILVTPYPPAQLSEEQLAQMQSRLTESIPLDSIITDLWNADIHFEEDLGDDWYFQALFGSAVSAASCAAQLADFFIEKCDDHAFDYDQSPESPEFRALVLDHANRLIRGWRKNILAQHTQPRAAGDIRAC